MWKQATGKMLAALTVLLGLSALHGCGGESTADTGVLVKVWLNESMLRDGDQIGVLYRTIDVDGDTVNFGELQPALRPTRVQELYNPITLAFVPAEGREGQGFQVAAALYRDEDVRLMQEYAVVYEPGEWHVLEMDLMRSCLDVECGRGETCSYGSCVETVVMARDLPVPSEQDAP